jgi:AcrR family transcriptional regulator
MMLTKNRLDEVNMSVYNGPGPVPDPGRDKAMSEIGRRREARAAADSPAYSERVLAIREAAVRVFRVRGFQLTTLNDIAEEAGMSRASLYYYVGSKEQLFRDVVSEAVAANIADAEEVVAQDLPADRKLARLIELLMESFERHYPYLYVFVQEDFSKLGGPAAGAHGSWEATIQDWNKRYLDLVKGVVADGIASGGLRTTLPPGVVANCLIGMTNSSQAWFRPHGLMDAADIGAGMARMILDGLRPGT